FVPRRAGAPDLRRRRRRHRALGGARPERAAPRGRGRAGGVTVARRTTGASPQGTGRTLFEAASRRNPELKAAVPLAERMRPSTLPDMVGQEHLLGEGKLLARAVAADRVPSMILWGPPGSGKTTLARVIAHHTNARF